MSVFQPQSWLEYLCWGDTEVLLHLQSRSISGLFALLLLQAVTEGFRFVVHLRRIIMH